MARMRREPTRQSWHGVRASEVPPTESLERDGAAAQGFRSARNWDRLGERSTAVNILAACASGGSVGTDQPAASDSAPFCARTPVRIVLSDNVEAR